MKNLIRAYFGQGVQYYSETTKTFRIIEDMHPMHAANAADKLLREAAFWAREAGVNTRRPTFWMACRPLFRALTARAGH